MVIAVRREHSCGSKFLSRFIPSTLQHADASFCSSRCHPRIFRVSSFETMRPEARKTRLSSSRTNQRFVKKNTSVCSVTGALGTSEWCPKVQAGTGAREVGDVQGGEELISRQ
ncbi:hypothetical protein AVEN_15990-1 [Araneus ventricosus]|uniref:Uncharacterized protein n=1 Tax=Araneus ventricosus TaxID=182803 RepID=A0A4Y2M7U9_ARAVE|nr:hypothetical protein AVEN_15990-1 [Araneus ventricosus]